MLSRLFIALLPRSRCLLISWLQSPSAVILEPKKIKSATAFTFFPSICHEVIEETVDAQRTAIQELQLQNELQGKDIEYIKNEQIDVKSDIKEIKATLNTMAIALERIAAKYDKD